LDAARLADDVGRVLADPAKTGQLADLVAQLVLVGMCAMLIVGLVYWAVARWAHRTWHTTLTDEERREMRAEFSQRLYRVLEALDPRATTLATRTVRFYEQRACPRRSAHACSRRYRPAAYRRHIGNRIRAGNTTPP
jgi:hypothetical protein